MWSVITMIRQFPTFHKAKDLFVGAFFTDVSVLSLKVKFSSVGYCYCNNTVSSVFGLLTLSLYGITLNTFLSSEWK